METAQERQDGFAAYLARIDLAAVEHGDGGLPSVLQPAPSDEDLELLEAELGFALPAEVRAFYGVTNGLNLFSMRLSRVRYLARTHHSSCEDFDGLDAEGLRSRVWGPAPKGKVLCLSYFEGGGLLYERDGPAGGALTYFDCMSNFGYRPVAPSLAALLEAWAGLLESDLVKVETVQDWGGWTSWSDEDLPKLRELMATLPATIMALGEPSLYDKPA